MRAPANGYRFWSTETGPARFWELTGVNRILCQAHAGPYLQAAILLKPNKRAHFTRGGNFYALKPADRRYLQTKYGYVCDTCHEIEATNEQ